jgi:hypothetical protein
MTPWKQCLAVLVLAATIPATALGGWGFSYHHDHVPHHYHHRHHHPRHYYGHHGHHGHGHHGHVHHFHYAPVVPYYPAPHYYGPPRTSIFLGF